MLVPVILVFFGLFVLGGPVDINVLSLLVCKYELYNQGQSPIFELQLELQIAVRKQLELLGEAVVELSVHTLFAHHDCVQFGHQRFALYFGLLQDNGRVLHLFCFLRVLEERYSVQCFGHMLVQPRGAATQRRVKPGSLRALQGRDFWQVGAASPHLVSS